MRPFVYSLLAAGLIGLYGGRVCPVIQAASLANWLSFLLAVFLSLAAIRRLLLGRYVLGEACDAQPRYQFFLDILLFFLGALATGVYPVLVYGSPPGNGLKVFFGSLSVGFFFSVELALQRERIVAAEACRRRSYWKVSDGYFPVTRKFAFVAGACVVFTALIISAVVIKDLYENISISSGPEFWSRSLYWVMVDLAFVIICLTGLVILVIASFAKNLRLFFTYQTDAMEAVTKGDLSSRVPVVTNDEFGFIASRTNSMIHALAERTMDLRRTQEVTILTLASLAETRDNETGAHILRTQRYVKELAEWVKNDPRYTSLLTSQYIDLLYQSAPLHDIGKVGVPDSILLKPGPLAPEEFGIMKKHVVYGYEALQVAVDRLGDSSFLKLAQTIALTHHEKWDGSGYVSGIQGEDIPLSGRIMALADVYDALISSRVYKSSFSHGKAKEIIIAGKGTHFDPLLVEAFLDLEQRFIAIAKEFQDGKKLTGMEKGSISMGQTSA
jgi:HD-GYP domain-containing protein (c-di-GMP phosphodiesterase class II)